MISDNLYGVFFMLTFFTLIWAIYNIIIRPSDPKKTHLMGGCLINIPKNIQKYVPFVNREGRIEGETCLDKWALGHFSLYLIIGLLFPNEYMIIIIVSILCETFEYFAKCRAKLSDVFVNFAGYYTGSILYKYHNIRLNINPEYKNIKVLGSTLITLLIIIAIHRRNLLKNIDDMSTKEEFTVN